MNEHIQKLAKQAYESCFKDPYFPNYTTDRLYAKFAELIVLECANFVENTFDDDGGHASCEDYAKGIKQHFGVKE